MLQITAILLIFTTVVPVLYYIKSEKGVKNKKTALFTNIGMFFVSMAVVTICSFTGVGVSAAGEAAALGAEGLAKGLGYIGAGLTTSCATVGAGIAVGAAASAALGALSENEKVFGKALIFVALAEGIALYGVLISVLILNTL